MVHVFLYGAAVCLTVPTHVHMPFAASHMMPIRTAFCFGVLSSGGLFHCKSSIQCDAWDMKGPLCLEHCTESSLQWSTKDYERQVKLDTAWEGTGLK